MGDCGTQSKKVIRRNEWDCIAHIKITEDCQNSSLLAVLGQIAASQGCWDSAGEFGQCLLALCRFLSCLFVSHFPTYLGQHFSCLDSEVQLG